MYHMDCYELDGPALISLRRVVPFLINQIYHCHFFAEINAIYVIATA